MAAPLRTMAGVPTLRTGRRHVPILSFVCSSAHLQRRNRERIQMQKPSTGARFQDHCRVPSAVLGSQTRPGLGKRHQGLTRQLLEVKDCEQMIHICCPRNCPAPKARRRTGVRTSSLDRAPMTDLEERTAPCTKTFNTANCYGRGEARGKSFAALAVAEAWNLRTRRSDRASTTAHIMR
jgi:hypothetical protein